LSNPAAKYYTIVDSAITSKRHDVIIYTNIPFVKRRKKKSNHIKKKYNLEMWQLTGTWRTHIVV